MGLIIFNLRALEASLVDNRSGNRRKRGNLWMSFIDSENPHERERKEGVPVGLKNIGNTCWFSAVIQVIKLAFDCLFLNRIWML